MLTSTPGTPSVSSNMASGSKSKILPPVKVLVAQSCPTLCDPMDCGLPGSSVCGILRARILEWVAMPFSRGSLQPKDWTWLSCGRQILYHLSCQGSPFGPNECCPRVQLLSGRTPAPTKRQVSHSPHTQNILGRQGNHSRRSHSREGEVGRHIIVTVPWKLWNIAGYMVTRSPWTRNRKGLFFLLFKKYLFLFIYLAVSGLSCSVWDLLLWLTDSLVLAHVLSSYCSKA